MSDSIKYAVSEVAFAGCMICIGCVIGGFVNYAMSDDPQAAVAPPAPVAAPSPPTSHPVDPPFAVVDYEDMAGLDAETQAMLAENERAGNDIDRRLRAIEANLDALNTRVFGPRVRPGAIGEMGAKFDAGPSILGSDGSEATQ